MAINCQINVIQPPNNEFTPGSIVCGTIKYEFYEETVVERVVVSFKGYGRLHVIETRGSGDSESKTSDSNGEDYIYLKDTILNDVVGISFAIGAYETAFSFELPQNCPSSLDYCKNDFKYDIICKIIYCLRIKFHCKGMFKFNKSYETEIKVKSGIQPTLHTKPLIYGDRKTLFQPFSINTSIVNLKVCIKSSVIKPGGKVQLVYELVNDTNKTVQAIKTKIVEVFTFYKTEKRIVKRYADIKNTDSKTSAVKSGNTVEASLEIDIPTNLCSLGNSKIVSRDYSVVVIVSLPLPHIDMPLEIPIQVGNISDKRFIPSIDYGTEVPNELPPSYWESMNTDEKR